MGSHFLQKHRRARLSTSLGENALVLLRMDGSEEMSGPFTWKIEALSEDPDVDLDALLGTHATVEMDSGDAQRHFDGIVAEATWVGMEENGNRYDLVLKPWMFLASLRRNQRIFHNMTVVEIVDAVFQDYSHVGPDHTAISLSDDYPVLEYTVQYGESDAAFVSRLMERFGISWHWTHKAGAHTLVLTDQIGSHEDVPGGTRPYYGIDTYKMHDEEHFRSWRRGARVTTGSVRLTEYNFKTPTAAQEVEQAGELEHANGQIESYDWPGDYLDQGQGRGVVATRAEAETGQASRVVTTGDVAMLGAGLCVTPVGNQLPGDTGKRFVCLKAQHVYRAQAFGSGDAKGAEEAYDGTYVLMPANKPFRPERRTVLPRIVGPQTATVVGDGEIDCDEYGRILVQFHWDLAGAYSMRCRVSQSWASKGWGGMVIPRIGMEVVVEFLEGDPDKPLVTGCVFNGRNDAPYPLPDHKTKSVFRSDSHQSDGFNELTFEDATGEENISLHAQKDQTLRVLHNRMKRIDNDQVESVGSNKAIDVGSNHQEKIGGSMNLTVGGGGFGGALGMFGTMAGLLGSGAQGMAQAAGDVGDGGLSKLVGGLVAGALGGEAGTAPGHIGFAGAGQHRAIAGADQVSKGTTLGGLVGAAMPISGIMNTVVEKAKSDTIGMARTEQIGLMKNTFVGQVQNTTVGKKQTTQVGEEQIATIGKLKKTVVGDEYVIEVGKAKLVMKKDGSVTLTGVRFNFEASGPVQVVGKVIDLN
ncbi:type VI secretion system Vgr family protein [Tateyamaria sp. SN6-1]|uniref:type VI secretion system Vgr family protein n=1 Tax=Tateyamaria sp. SN6-1 TaxID=3092148 RepID=UPI0039F53830